LRNADGTLPAECRLLDQGTFRAWCEETGGVSEPDQLLAYLHNAGVVFYRPGLFRDRIVLDQAWALKGIYALFDRTRCYKRLLKEGGRFDRARLEELVWREQGYTVAEQRLFLSMMQSCGICFTYRRGPHEMDDDDDETMYVAPDLLPDRAAVQTALDDRWGVDAPTGSMTFHYPLLHLGLMRGVIARIGNMAGVDAIYWQGGVYVYETTTRSRALIEQQIPLGAWQGKIQLQTRGAHGYDLMVRLGAWIIEENGRMGLRPAIESSAPSIPRGPDWVDAPPLAFAMEPFDYCVSYAWGDDSPEGRAREAYVDRLCAEAKRRGFHILRDKTALGLGDSISAFMRTLSTGKRVFIILSDKYLRSPNCTYELFLVWQGCRASAREFRNRVRIFKLSDVKLGTPQQRQVYHDWWKRQLKHQGTLIAKLQADGNLVDLPALDFERYKAMSRFAGDVLNILSLINDMLQPRTWEDFIRYGFGDPPQDASCDAD
jgi:internalin A